MKYNLNENVNKKSGFTLIELVIAVAIVGLIATFAYPAYTESQVRSRITEGLTLALEAHLLVANTDTAVELNAVIAIWNARLNGQGASSFYVRSILFDAGDDLVITFNENTVGSLSDATNTMFYRPYLLSGGAYLPLRAALLAGNISGFVRWACVSTTANYSQLSQGLPPVGLAALGSLPADLVPINCR
jgi:type IV pilus assembly protein PilA